MKFYAIKNILLKILNVPVILWPHFRRTNKQPKFFKLAAQENMCIMGLSEILYHRTTVTFSRGMFFLAKGNMKFCLAAFSLSPQVKFPCIQIVA
jgi:hypothetical protein